MFNKILNHFKWYRRKQYLRVTKEILEGDNSSILVNLSIWLRTYLEFVGEVDIYSIRFDSDFERVVDILSTLGMLEKELLEEHVGNIKSLKINNLLFDDWFVTKDNYRYSIQDFEENLIIKCDSIGRVLVGQDYSSRSYYDGKYESLYVTLRNYVEVIDRQIVSLR